MPESTADPAGDLDTGYDEGEGRRLSFALVWSFVQGIGGQLLTVVVTFLLARELGPGLFGLAALAIVYVLFVDMLMRQGLSAALIQRPNITPRELSTAFWLLLVASVLIVLATIGLAGAWASLNNEPDLRKLTIVLSVIVPLRAMSVVPDSLLRRELDFKTLALRAMAASVVGAAVALVLAATGAGVWALIWQQIAMVATELVLVWAATSWRPRMVFSRSAARELLAYALPSSAATMGVFVSERSDTVVTSIYFGPVAVGLHRFSVRFTDVLVGMFSGPFLQVSLPELARQQHDRSALSARIVDLMHVSALLAFPVFAGLAAAAEEFVGLAGDEWSAAARPLQLLCLTGALKSLSFYNAPVLQALGRTRLLATTEWGQAVFKTATVVAVAYSLRNDDIADQVVGITVAMAAVEAVFLFGIAVPMLRRTAGVRPGAVVKNLFVPAIGGFVGVGLVSWLRSLDLFDPMPGIIALGVTGGIGTTTALLAELVFDKRLVSEIRSRLGR